MRAIDRCAEIAIYIYNERVVCRSSAWLRDALEREGAEPHAHTHTHTHPPADTRVIWHTQDRCMYTSLLLHSSSEDGESIKATTWAALSVCCCCCLLGVAAAAKAAHSWHSVSVLPSGGCASLLLSFILLRYFNTHRE